MSVQFGRWNFDGKPVDRDYLEKVTPVIVPYGPDGGGSYSKGNISIVYRAFHTTKESRRELQPHVMASGAVITWDGRLDNRAELIHTLRGVLTINSTDVSIVAAAYEQWDTDCFAMLIGDWALSVWNPGTRSLILAKDPIGTRHLYYSFDKNKITWSTILDPLVLFAGKTFVLEKEYIAGWLSFFPASHLTPYVGIHSVPPSSLVLIQAGKHTVRRHWDFNPDKAIRYTTDGEYEEHFRAVLSEAVRCRLRSDAPTLAELSGGMDSSSIVCLADLVIARGVSETTRLDTISYYDDSEPNWNERPYFEKVEQKRGRTGCHINVNSRQSLNLCCDSDHFAATPGSGGHVSEAAKQFAACLSSQGNRVVLSGISGDEVTGGVPTPTPELKDLLARMRLRMLAHQLKIWALNKRKPWFQLFCEAARGFFPPALVRVPKYRRPAAWLHPNFAKDHWTALTGYESKVKLFGTLPSFQENVSTLDALRRQLGCDALPLEPCYEKRYPYLDRGLLEFVFAIPREQLVRPGHRRSLMRRSLAGIVPCEILERKRKAYMVRQSLSALQLRSEAMFANNHEMICHKMGIINSPAFREAISIAASGQMDYLLTLLDAITIEFWVRQVVEAGLIAV